MGIVPEVYVNELFGNVARTSREGLPQIFALKYVEKSYLELD